ncbi:hypothetical protein AVEN_121135-1 [Araneus ventricosus]|uniref:Uncharacterized protein n=1 Tax=Araneus ventricosus TaxID=182803 RepID=A0A4Y2DZS2_ARAVE|nr:hypothetical protein AVEN_121135-1 [Araneus ventricosus]
MIQKNNNVPQRKYIENATKTRSKMESDKFIQNYNASEGSLIDKSKEDPPLFRETFSQKTELSLERAKAAEIEKCVVSVSRTAAYLSSTRVYKFRLCQHKSHNNRPSPARNKHIEREGIATFSSDGDVPDKALKRLSFSKTDQYYSSLLSRESKRSLMHMQQGQRVSPKTEAPGWKIAPLNNEAVTWEELNPGRVWWRDKTTSIENRLPYPLSPYLFDKLGTAIASERPVCV